MIARLRIVRLIKLLPREQVPLANVGCRVSVRFQHLGDRHLPLDQPVDAAADRHRPAIAAVGRPVGDEDRRADQVPPLVEVVVDEFKTQTGIKIARPGLGGDEQTGAAVFDLEGRVVVEYFPGQTLTKARQVYDGVVEGISDVGFSVLAYTRGRFPVMSAVDLPLGYTSGTVATKVINAVYKKFMPKEFMDTQVMYLHAHGPGLIHTKGKAVYKMEDMKGLKFRGHGTSALVVKALGGTPVPKPMPETYQMLQKGVVDGAVYPFEANKGWKLGEVTNYCTADFSAAYTTSFFVVI